MFKFTDNFLFFISFVSLPETDSITELIKDTNDSSIVEVPLDMSLNEQAPASASTEATNEPSIVKTDNEIKRAPLVAKKKKVVKKNFNVEGINNNNNNAVTASNPSRPFSSSSARVMSAKSGSASLVEKVGLDDSMNPTTAPTNAKAKNVIVRKSESELKSVKTITRKKKMSQN